MRCLEIDVAYTPALSQWAQTSFQPYRSFNVGNWARKGIRNCRSTRHKDGGPLRPPPPPRKGAGNLEEDDNASQEASPGVDVGTLEIELNALSSVGSDTLSFIDEAQA